MRRVFTGGLALALLIACTPTALPATLIPAPVTAVSTLSSTLEPTTVPEPISDLILGDTVQVTSADAAEEAPDKSYTINTSIPVLTGPSDARLDTFNQLAASLIREEIIKFKNDFAELPTPEPDMSGSFVEVQYEALTPSPTLLSVRFSVSFYAQGAAHPGAYFMVVNYDLAAGRELTLAEVFRPDSGYLEHIAEKCVAELSTRDLGELFDGTAPTPENYRNWNLTAEGLRISFDPYQVAAYAAGPQEVLIPWAELQDLINPAVVNFGP